MKPLYHAAGAFAAGHLLRWKRRSADADDGGNEEAGSNAGRCYRFRGR